MSSSQFQCHRDVIDDTKVRIWSELECSAASRTELLTSASTTFSAVRCLSHFGFLRARSVAAAEYRLDSAENLRGKLSGLARKFVGVLPSTEIGEDAFSFGAHECGLGTWSR
jgi:hypothetical protein